MSSRVEYREEEVSDSAKREQQSLSGFSRPCRKKLCTHRRKRLKKIDKIMKSFISVS